MESYPPNIADHDFEPVADEPDGEEPILVAQFGEDPEPREALDSQILAGLVSP